MFEVVVMLCLATGGDTCRDVLLPGYEGGTQAECAARIAAQPPEVPAFSRGSVEGDPRCVPAGPVLDLAEVAPGLWVHQGLIEEPDTENGGDVSNLAIVIGGDSVAVIDSGSARWIGESLWRAIRARTDLPVSHVILTHVHPDHVFGASVLAEAGAEVVGHEGLPRALADREENYLDSLDRLVGAQGMLGTEPPEVTETVADTAEIDLGARVLRLDAWPAAHTTVDLTVFDAATGTLLAGDLLFHRHTPALDGSLRGWQAALAELEGQGTHVVPGHGDPLLPWPEGGTALKRYLDTLARETRAAIDAGERLGEAVKHIAESERDAWELFDAYNPRNATLAFTELEWE
ncbi:MBL fold metallo-hydrolase (plasmid) [Sagittula sp. P11]|uniref:quinoprotein relay system zinc metallohydrolase 2 n=1 Tax=Sagittula sp. P11 TaxID=2009329 RepID=UPI000C2D1D89|nr:quinoprotein relay system zinc metallohydrolase 2 [Sagittula sp. P11]AUC56103.1 MBL fold metallo-hydrolase [Sagittula sp. P11]